jgi:hypothetical protein
MTAGRTIIGAIVVASSAFAAACAPVDDAGAPACLDEIGCATGAQSAATATVFTSTQWNDAIDGAIASDTVASVRLPDGDVLWIFGDTTNIGGMTYPQGLYYPHQTFLRQQAGRLNFTALQGFDPTGHPWQQVPNWSDGSCFWPSTAVAVDGSRVVLFGVRDSNCLVSGTMTPYVATFDATTLAFQRAFALPARIARRWAGITRDTNGFDLVAGDGVMAYVPYGDLTTPSAWTLHDVTFTNAAGGTSVWHGEDVESARSLRAPGGGWDLFVAFYGATSVSRYHASAIHGPYALAARAPIGDTITDGVALHPEQAAPSGRVLMSWSHGTTVPQFRYVTR